MDGFTCTRFLLEAVLRQEALSDRAGSKASGAASGEHRAHLTFLNGRSAAELLLDEGSDAVTGVLL